MPPKRRLPLRGENQEEESASASSSNPDTEPDDSVRADDEEEEYSEGGDDNNSEATYDDEEEEVEEDEEECAEEEEEDDDVDSELGPDPIHVSAQLAGQDSCKMLHFHNEVSFADFKAGIASALGLPPDSKFELAKKRRSKPPQPIAKKRQFDQLVDDFFEGNDKYIRLLVTPDSGHHAAHAHGAHGASAAAAAAAAAPAAVASAMATLTAATATNNQFAGTNNSNIVSPNAASGGMQPVTSTDFNFNGSIVGGASSTSQRPTSSYSRTAVSNEMEMAIKAAFDQGPVKWTEMRTLGSGAFGKVVEAITTNGHIVAVKHMIFPSGGSDGGAGKQSEAEQMVEEIRLMKHLRHRHIVGYYGCQTQVQPEGGRIVDVFMEACHGGSLNSLRKKVDKVRGRLPVGLVRSYTRQVLEGLLYLHLKQVVHRDIKGDNVLIDSHGVAKLADFGCSKKLGGHSFEDTLQLEMKEMTASSSGTVPAALDQQQGQQQQQQGTMAKTLVGTPLFIAPEVLTEDAAGYLASADIWSVGCLIIELFGHKPWVLQNTSIFSVMFAIAQCKTLPTGMPDLEATDPKLIDFLTQCFRREPSARPSARQLLEHIWITCADSELGEPVWKDDNSASVRTSISSGSDSASVRK